MAGKRDNAYFLERLKRDHPAIHAKLASGSIKSVRLALLEARMIRLPTRIDALKRLWTGASGPEKVEFYSWFMEEVRSATDAASAKSAAKKLPGR